MSEGNQTAALIEGWLQPLADEAGPCGPNLEYEADFLSLVQAAAGKPESQFEAAVPPDWRSVRTLAETLLGKTRDLRIAVLWLRAVLSTDGLVALPAGLAFLHGLVDSYWDGVHPQLDADDGDDPFARMSALAELPDATRVLGDVRRAVICRVRGFGDIQVRTVELSLGLMSPREGEDVVGRDQLSTMLLAAAEHQPELLTLPADALAALRQLSSLLNDRVGSSVAPDFKPLQALLHSLSTAMPKAPDEAPVADAMGLDEGGAGTTAASAKSPAGRGLSGSIQSREEAMRAIDLVCEFLERTEPTNPAQWMLRRSRRLLSQNFLQLLKELAPDALADVARVMGVDPDTVQLDP